jgi:hypothetical protein
MKRALLVLVLVSCSSSPDAAMARFDAGPFTVAPGSELVMCTFVRGSNETEADVTRFVTEQTHGGHHLIVYTIDHPVDSPPVPCSQGGQPSWSQIAVSQVGEQTQAFPPGVGFRVMPRQQYVMETHYINTTSQPITVTSSFSERFARPGEVTTRAATYFFGTMNIDVAPHSSASKTASCKPPFPMSAHTMFGHQHRAGTGVSVDVGDQRVYETKLWEGPPISTFAQGMPIDTIRVTCDWQNDGDTRLRFPHEMCFAIGYYWPAERGIFCATGGQNDACICRSTGDANAGPGGSKVVVKLRRKESIEGVKGKLDAGAPIYCALFRTEDWAAFVPKQGAEPKYLRDAVDVRLATEGDVATFDIDDVTPGEYAVTCMMDTVGGGFFTGSGDVVNLDTPKIETFAGKTTNVDVRLDFALP